LGRAAASAEIEAARQGINGGGQLCNMNGTNIALAGLFSAAGDLSGSLIGNALSQSRNGWMPIENTVAGVFWGGHAAGSSGSPLAALDSWRVKSAGEGGCQKNESN